MLTLTLDGSEVDLPADAEVALTLWAHDLRNSASREATFSETFTLPPSGRNSAALRTPHVLGSQTAAPYRKVPAVLRAGGLVVLDGVAVLEQTSGEGYDVTLYAPTADLHALVKERHLRDLDLSAYAHPLTYASVAGAQGNDYTEGYTYPLADDGRLSTRSAELDGAVLFHEVGPFVFWHTLLTQILAECLPGYTLAGSLLSEERYRRIGFPRARPFPALSQARQDGLALRVRRGDDFTAVEPTGNDGKLYPVLPLPEIISAGDEASWATAQYFVVPAGLPCDVSVKAQLLLSVFAGPSASRTILAGLPNQVAVRVISDPNGTAGPANTQVGTETVIWRGYVQPGGPTSPYPVNQLVTLEHTLEHLEPGTVVAIQFYLYWGMGVTVHAGSTAAFSVGERTYAGGPVDLAQGLPGLSQADFLQLLANTFQVIPQADAVTRTVRFDLFTDVERNRNRAVDWTAKLDRSTLPATTFRLDGYAQRNRYAWDDAPSQYEALLRSGLELPGYLSVADTTLEATADAYVAPVFAAQAHPALGATPMAWLPAVARAGLGHHLYDPDKPYTTDDGPVVYAGRYWQYSATPVPGLPVPDAVPSAGTTYIGHLIWEPLPESAVLSVLNDELAAVALLTPGPPVAPGVVLAEDAPGATMDFARGLTSAGLDWAADLLPAYYATLQALLVRARVLRLPFTLTRSDIAGLDHTRPVALNVPFWPGVGPIIGLFYLNIIDQWLPGVAGSTMVELIRLGEPVPGIAPPAEPLPPGADGALLEETGRPLRLETTAYLLQES